MPFDPTLIVFGAIIGLSLGLTGSGGSILAIPLLIYGAGIDTQQALSVSLLMVACIAAFGAVKQSFNKYVDWRAAAFFSLSGIIVSPFIVSLTHNVSDTLRLGLFAILMLIVAARMYFSTKKNQDNTPAAQNSPPSLIQIGAGGAVAGALAGFFGVGGGFIIVPLLTLIFSMPYKKAVGTSLASIALISSSALAGHFFKGTVMDMNLVFLFVIGGGLGLYLGTMMVNKISDLAAKRVFSLITASLAIFMLIDKFLLHQEGLI